MEKEYVYNRNERILRMKATLEVKLWDLEDLQREIENLQYRIKQLEEKEQATK
jgi:hypothetical protein